MKTLAERIKPYWGLKSYADIAKIFNTTAESVRKTGRNAGYEPYKVNSQNRQLTTEQEIERDVTVSSLKRKSDNNSKKYDFVCTENEKLKAMLTAFTSVGSGNTSVVPFKKESGNSEVTAFAIASDWHFEEQVESNNVNGKNEFNLEIAEGRVKMFFVNVARLTDIFGKESKLDTLYIALLGDLINGQLREEAMENNLLRPMEAMLRVRELLKQGIQYLLDNTKLNLVLHCHSGNHARTTKKIHISTESGNSLEWVLYHVLGSDFKNNKRVLFVIPTSYHSFADVAGVKVRFHHGHAMRYAGGVGGISISVNKAIAQWNRVERADLDVFGHFHQLKDGGNFVCNGSLIGWNEFANFIKADFEKPKQAFFLIDHKRKEKTVTTPIFLT